ncbi:hypothetical protein CEUSTIGMA_g11629.t1 [Chlamydomonas eustigma]|uniref:Protein kinase domain-containing protein n=1 Tax=Chlamydomonas eustigma TaxID=1157962 RepID=A0A250XMG1_9CHLO|nr:hypothetical protein CEUSTIGMA_g11629.t1 [Chlamydomonas eustigma]|eukprot:GAX84206.1 hypothetical protein CEUSTIGMA_g11629.t1 [Chlamydomonas eustigma]
MSTELTGPVNSALSTLEQGSGDLSVSASGLPYNVFEQGCPRPPCEEERAKTVEALGLNCKFPDPNPELESILKIANSVFGTSISTLTLLGSSLGGDVNKDVVFVKFGDGCASGDCLWRWSFCSWITGSAQPQTLVVPDAQLDARFSDNIHVKGESAWLRSYCGAPLIASNGHRLGTICVCDTVARTFDAGQCMILNNLSEMAVRHIEKEKLLQMRNEDNEALKAAYRHMERALDCFEHCVVLVDASVQGFKIMYANEAWGSVTGISRTGLTGRLLTELLEDTMGGTIPSTKHNEAATLGKSFSIESAVLKACSLQKLLHLKFRPASSDPLDEQSIPIGIPTHVTATSPTATSKQLYFMAVYDAEAHRSGSSSGSYWKTSRSSNCSLGYQREEDDVEGLVMGHLIGRGSYGSVYAGSWFGSNVAVKIIESNGRKSFQTASLEAAISTDLRHPNIVATLKSWVKNVGCKGHRGTSQSIPQIQIQKEQKNDDFQSSHPLQEQHNDKGVTLQNRHSFAACKRALRAATVPDLSLASHVADLCNTYSRQNSNLVESKTGWPIISTCDLKSVLYEEEEEQQQQLGEHAISERGVTGVVAGARAEECGAEYLSVPLALYQQEPLPFPESLQTLMIMEYCDKGCLQDALDRGWLLDECSCITGKPRMEAVLGLALQIASAMQYLHSENVMHGDLSAWNVLLTSVGAKKASHGLNFLAKVADFGLARDISEKIQTQTYGTITHQPPETLMSGIVSKAVDVYAFGVLMWQMYTGSQPWRGLTHAQILLKVTAGVDRLRFPLSTPIEYEDLAMSCMAFSAEERPDFETICDSLGQIRDQLCDS